MLRPTTAAQSVVLRRQPMGGGRARLTGAALGVAPMTRLEGEKEAREGLGKGHKELDALPCRCQ